ncbi:conserved hypothetical protein [Theileria equi strain WA]|uniref:RRM domain-containing protein n=1 Tax=Theileria equi strain WA TaxID=1537102 RepID=L1LD69_THEEQ|nr:conserved hypothetical protein [Theileria equi strain WA]EKX73200.1 conserved hypothetical protein [Theileria equi strain WA]|eukprot:XP_004832652.1 conserved hypothetical protein [Theileria equi strain WA]
MGYRNRSFIALLCLVILFDLPFTFHLKSTKLFISCSYIGTNSLCRDKLRVSENDYPGILYNGSKYAFLSPIKLHLNTHSSVKLNAEFKFDEKKAKRKKHASNKPKKTDKEKHTLEGLTRIATKNTQEWVLSKELEKFFREADYIPNKMRLPTPPSISSPSYDALLYLKGLPFETTEDEIFNWLKNYDIVSIILIKNEKGLFTGDAYVRCANIAIRDTVAKEMDNKELGVRYIQIFRVNENAYLEYYYSGYRKEPAKRNFVDISLLVVPESKRKKQMESKEQKMYHIDEIKTGMRITGTVTEVYKNGVIVDCDVYDVKDGFKENVICVLKRNRIAKNVGIEGQHMEWLKSKDLVIFPGLQLNLYVEKVRDTTARKTYDKDIWIEHFSESLIKTYTQKVVFIPEESEAKAEESTLEVKTTPDYSVDAPEYAIKNTEKVVNIRSDKHTIHTPAKNFESRKLVYLTMDSTVSEDKAIWWEKKILQKYLKNAEIKDFDNVAVKNAIQYHASKMASTAENVEKDELVSGKRRIYGNISHHELTPGNFQSEDKKVATKKQVDFPVTETIEIESSLYDTSPSSSDRYSEMVKEFFKDSGDMKDGVMYHGFNNSSGESEHDYSDLEGDERKANYYNNILYQDPKDELELFPRITLYDPSIKLPTNGLLLRTSEVPRLTNDQVNAILQILGKEPGDEPSANRILLTETITNEGLPTDLSPQTLIQKGLYKVKQSKRSMKKIINLTKHLTGRRFTQEDLDSASKKELQMLVEESLYKFLNWNPEQKVKKDFINNYCYLLDKRLSLPNISDIVPTREFPENIDSFSSIDHEIESAVNVTTSPESQNEGDKIIEKMWNDLKWIIVINIYGKQSDLEEIIKDIKGTDKQFNMDLNAAKNSLNSEVLKLLEEAVD